MGQSHHIVVGGTICGIRQPTIKLYDLLPAIEQLLFLIFKFLQQPLALGVL